MNCLVSDSALAAGDDPQGAPRLRSLAVFFDCLDGITLCLPADVAVTLQHRPTQVPGDSKDRRIGSLRFRLLIPFRNFETIIFYNNLHVLIGAANHL